MLSITCLKLCVGSQTSVVQLSRKTVTTLQLLDRLLFVQKQSDIVGHIATAFIVHFTGTFIDFSK